MAMQSTPSPQGEDRRDFLKSCGKFAVTVPPAMTLLLSTSLSSPAIAQSTGGATRDGRSGGHDHGNPHADYPRPKVDRGRSAGH